MSVTIHWRPIDDKRSHFRGGTTTSLDRLKKIFGNTIKPSHVETLRAMGIAAQDGFYDEVADLVEHIGAIEIWGEY